MNIKSLISPEFPVLSLDDTGDKALRLMSEFRVFHLPLIQRDNYIALISEDDLLDWDTPEEPLSLAEFLTFRPAIVEQKHPYDAMKLARELNLSLVPVVNEHNHFAGVVTSEGLVAYLSDNRGIQAEGSILILEMESRNYSLTEIARICESNDCSVQHLSMQQDDQTGLIQITLKVNQTDIEALRATFDRFNYQVVETYSVETKKDSIQQNYDMLMHYINI
ncbi:MAG: hypothetical protein RIQ62_328 [Bacteroidota bacterium]